MRDEETFRFAVPTLDRLPPALRLRALCGGLLRGGIEGADFIDMKVGIPRLTFIQCMDASARLPVISEMTRVDLGRALVTVDRPDGLGSRLIQHQQMSSAAMATAEAKLRASLSYRVWMRRQSFNRPKVRSMAFRAR